MAERPGLDRKHAYNGTSPLQMLDDCRAAMAEVGRRDTASEYFVPELSLAGATLRQLSEADGTTFKLKSRVR